MLWVVAALLAAAPVRAAESGLQPGEGVPAFQVQDVSGPHMGHQLCYV